ncbi:site-specific integrase [Limosilactobacillus antri]|uniref:Phage integrase SAM-like domain protein n=1 Tax=Limosilactobacillus antri DSM 16041 TaxID=525309 RepID=C8P8Q9_9LACO|nr:site-specific integrase [Limosilactobacillus antri]EEW53147.1 phage integrase SAM-like domain protein [Limosilactobacillus antri DSM 16041]KRK56544.1 hypothetical protein FC31_GL001304 [Limosilactobacillus antri DSM 16041]
MDYPYQKAFRRFLSQQDLSPLTIKTYDTSLTNLFSYLQANRPQFARQPTLANLTETDVRAYLSYLQADKQITMTTYNKILSQLNRYFRYLFTHQLINDYPTLTLHGRAVAPNQRVASKWLAKLDQLLADDHLHYYTRLTLLLSKYGYTVGEFLQPGFNRVFEQLTLKTPAEEKFRQQFLAYIAPRQQLQVSPDLFLKQRFNPTAPRLSNPALHKFLHQDEEYLGFSLAPKYLHQSYVLLYLASHRQDSDQQLAEALQLDPSSLLYYKRLLINTDL